MKKALVVVISITCMATGLWKVRNSIIPDFPSPDFIYIKIGSINVSSLIGGVLLFYAGLNMLRLIEFGRNFVIILLSFSVANHALSILWFFLNLEDIAGSGIFEQGKLIYKFENRYAYPVLLLLLLMINLLTIVFLSQQETRKLFKSEAINIVDSNNIKSDTPI